MYYIYLFTELKYSIKCKYVKFSNMSAISNRLTKYFRKSLLYIFTYFCERRMTQ